MNESSIDREAEIDSRTSTDVITGENNLQPNNNNGEAHSTPGKILNVVSPIPTKIDKVKKRSLRVAEILTSVEYIESKRKRTATLIKKEEIKKVKSDLSKNIPKSCEKTNNAVDVKPGVSGLQKIITKGTKGLRKKRQSETESSTDESFAMSSASDSNIEMEEENGYCCQGNTYLLFFCVNLPVKSFLHFRLWRRIRPN